MTLGEEVLPPQEIFDEREVNTMIDAAWRDYEREVAFFTNPAERLLAKGKMKGYEALLIVANSIEHSVENPPPKPYLTDKQIERLRLTANYEFQQCRDARNGDTLDEENLDFQTSLISAKRVKHQIFIGLAWQSFDSIKSNGGDKLSGRKFGLCVTQINFMLGQFLDDMFDEHSLEVDAKKHFHYPFISEIAYMYDSLRGLKPRRTERNKKNGGDYPHKLWMDEAACKDVGDAGDVMFPSDGRGTTIAQKVCRDCVVRQECTDYAIEHRIDQGVWGGMSERARRIILRDNVEVDTEDSTA